MADAKKKRTDNKETDNAITPINTTAYNYGNQGEEEKKVGITDLPEDIIRQIREFFSIDALLLLENRYLHSLKGRLYFYKFTKKCSLKYHASEAFREASEAARP